jgi:hypothetical protein
MQSPLHILSSRLQSETPVCGVALEPYILVRRADGTTVSAGETISMNYARARWHSRQHRMSTNITLSYCKCMLFFRKSN